MSSGSGSGTGCISIGDVPANGRKNALQADPTAAGDNGSIAVTKAYLGDIDGNYWRFDFNASASMSARQMINTSAPIYASSALLFVGSVNVYMYFATGSDLLATTAPGLQVYDAGGLQTAPFAGLTGLGDLITTCTSPQSRNRTVGFELGQGRPIAEIVAGMNQVAEGVKSCAPIYNLARAKGVEVPIVREVYKVIHEGRDPRAAFTGLLKRGARSEAEPG